MQPHRDPASSDWRPIHDASILTVVLMNAVKRKFSEVDDFGVVVERVKQQVFPLVQWDFDAEETAEGVYYRIARAVSHGMRKPDSLADALFLFEHSLGCWCERSEIRGLNADVPHREMVVAALRTVRRFLRRAYHQTLRIEGRADFAGEWQSVLGRR